MGRQFVKLSRCDIVYERDHPLIGLVQRVYNVYVCTAYIINVIRSRKGKGTLGLLDKSRVLLSIQNVKNIIIRKLQTKFKK